MPRKSRFQLQEWHRTIVLIILFAIGLGVIYWTNSNVDDNFVDQFVEPTSQQPTVDPEAQSI